MSYIIAPFRQVKAQFPEFLDAMRTLEAATKQRAEAIWQGYTFGGLFPEGKQYGLGNILPKNTTGVARLLGSNSFVQRYTAPGSWVNILSYTVADDLIHSFAGLAFTDPYLIFNAIRLTATERIYPQIWLEEARAFSEDAKGVAVILKPDPGEELVVPEKTAFLLEGYQERGTSGITQRIIPLGVAAYRKRDIYITKSAN